jgi:carbon monoxide dehydrogenase subunit G
VELSHTFRVPASVEETWAAFNDIEAVAECFPGASVSAVEGDEFKGSCKVKLGPISLTYAGEGTFVEKDESARRMVIDARGKDKRGNGTAAAKVVATFAAADGNGTQVDVTTDLSITGKPAQFGRGVIQDVSDKLLQQFMDCLESRVGAPAGKHAAEAPAATEPPAEAESPAAAAAAAAAHTTPRKAPASTYAGATAGAEVPGAATEGTAEGRPPGLEAIDLGATVLPVIARTYWRQAAGALLVLLVLRMLLRRRRR